MVIEAEEAINGDRKYSGLIDAFSVSIKWRWVEFCRHFVTRDVVLVE